MESYMRLDQFVKFLKEVPEPLGVGQVRNPKVSFSFHVSHFLFTCHLHQNVALILRTKTWQDATDAVALERMMAIGLHVEKGGKLYFVDTLERAVRRVAIMINPTTRIEVPHLPPQYLGKAYVHALLPVDKATDHEPVTLESALSPNHEFKSLASPKPRGRFLEPLTPTTKGTAIHETRTITRATVEDT